VTRYLLDTNIISNVTKLDPSKALLAWMAEQTDSDLFISALTIAEIQRGLLEKAKGKNELCWKPGSPARKDHKHYSQAASCLSTRRRP
jgi:hypothetical protein